MTVAKSDRKTLMGRAVDAGKKVAIKVMAEVRDQASQSSFNDHMEPISETDHFKDMQIQVPSSPLSYTTSVSLDGENICRICLDKGTEPLVAPCKCAGSAKFAHESCLLQWFFKTRRRKCELCLSEVNVKSVGFKPLQKWRLPTDSCDFVFYLFSLYCVIMFVFTGMIIWIATQGCISPVCITLYVICSMSLVYFIYCCGCVEYSKAYWKACLTTNKNWRIYNREESARSKIKVSKVISVSSDSGVTKKISDQTCVVPVVALPDADVAPVEMPSCGDMDACYSLYHQANMTGSTTMIHAQNTADVVCKQPSRTSMSPEVNSPVCVGSNFAHTGSISLLVGINYSPQSSPCRSLASADRSQSPDSQYSAKLTSQDGSFPQDQRTETGGSGCDIHETLSQKFSNGLSNGGYHDTKL